MEEEKIGYDESELSGDHVHSAAQKRPDEKINQRWDRLLAILIAAAILSWTITWIVTGIWWTTIMIFPTIFLVLVVVVPIANRADGFKKRGRRA